MTNIKLVRWILKQENKITTIIGIVVFIFGSSVVLRYFFDLSFHVSMILEFMEFIILTIAIILSFILSKSMKEIKKFINAEFSTPTQEEFEERLERGDVDDYDC